MCKWLFKGFYCQLKVKTSSKFQNTHSSVCLIYFRKNYKLIGPCCSFYSVGHSSKGHHPPGARKMKQASRVICAHTTHLANTSNPTLQSRFMVFNLKIADSWSTKEHLELCQQQSTLVASRNISSFITFVCKKLVAGRNKELWTSILGISFNIFNQC